MDTKYEVKITRQATEQMRETVGFLKKRALIDENLGELREYGK